MHYEPDNQDGYSAKALLDILHEFGIYSIGLRGDIVGLYNYRDGYLILHIKRNHYVVMERITRDRISIWDPAFGRIELGILDFKKIYNKIFIYVKNNIEINSSDCFTFDFRKRIHDLAYSIADIFISKPGIEFVMEDIKRNKTLWNVFFVGRLIFFAFSIIITFIYIGWLYSLIQCILCIAFLLDASKLYHTIGRRLWGYLLEILALATYFGFLSLHYINFNLILLMVMLSAISLSLCVYIKEYTTMCYKLVFLNYDVNAGNR